WSLQGNQGDKWLQGIAQLPTCASEFNILVEGIRGTSFTGDIALDDFRFEQCYENPPLPTCAQVIGDPNQFMCQSKHCILQENKCDYELDCCDGSDEDNNICYEYQRCDFETDFCLWKPTTDSQLEWKRYRVNAIPYDRRPPYDHTTRSQLGYYLQLPLNSTIQRDTLATISSYLGVAAQQGCTMRFWIYFKSSNNGQLVVGYRHTIEDEIRSLPFSNYQSCQTNAIQCSWQRIDVSLNTILTQSTEIIIGVRTGADRDGIMAIDDITYTPQCVQHNETMSTPYTDLSKTTTAITTYTGPSTTISTTTPYTDPPTTTTRMTTIASIETSATTGTAEITTTTYAQCTQYACSNDGICKPSSTQIGEPMCECKPGFNGPQCENEETSPKKNNLGAILGGVFGGLAAITFVVVGYIYVSSKKRAARVANASAQLPDSLSNGSTKNPTYNETVVTDT
ncbi:unnamed protein product, partial [Rotaria sp. Silwood1]